MSDDPEKPKFALPKALRKTSLSKEGIIFAELEMRSIGFYSWFHKGKESKNWSDSISFVRSLLTDRATSIDSNKPLETDWVNLISNEEIEAFAAEILPQVFNTSEIDSNSKEPSSVKLFGGVEFTNNNHRDRMAEIAKTMQQLTKGSFAGLQNSIDPTSDIIKRTYKPFSLWANEIGQLNDRFSLIGRDAKRHLGWAAVPNLGIGSVSVFKDLSRQIAEAQRVWQSPLVKTGSLMTAGLALNDQVARGLASDILRHYDNLPTTERSLFKSSLEFTQQDDAEVWSLRNSIDNLEKILVQIDSNQSKDPLNAAAILTILMFLITIYGTIITTKGYINDVSAREASEQAEAKRADLENKWQAQQDYDKRHIRYLISRTPLRVEPHRQATMIRLVFPDQLVKVLDSRCDWLWVEVYDYSSDQPIKGWLHRGNLRVGL